MFPNETSQTNLSSVLYFPRTRPPSSWGACRAPFVFLTFVEVITSISPFLVLFMLHNKIQRRMLYRHKQVKLPYFSPGSDVDFESPESQGFLRNQVTYHLIPTSDGHTLHSWLIMPLGAYTKHETVMTESWSADEAREIVLQILRSDPKAVVIVYLHGDGNHLATQWRCQAYQNLSSGCPNHIYVLAFDYRGFGKNSGNPSEEGLIEDAMSVLLWVEKKLTVPRARILIVGHGLGTAVAIAAVQRIVQKNRFAEYAGLVLCSGFTDVPALAINFKLFGVIPMVKPLTWLKSKGTRIHQKLITDCWWTQARLRELVKAADVIRISFVHARDDDRVPYQMSEILYADCAEDVRLRATAIERRSDLGSVGEAQEVRVGATLIRKVILRNGGHADYTSWHTVSFEAMRILTRTGAVS